MLSSGSSNGVAKTFLLTGEFPPMQTGIARMMGELTRRYPRGDLLVSTGQHRDAQDSDVRFSGAVIDRMPLPSKALRNIAGLLFWSRRVARLARKTAKALLGSAVAVVANSQWTREQAQKVLRELGLDPLAESVRLVPLGTDPEQFRPGIDTRAVRTRYDVNGAAWVLTVARPEPYKGVDMALRAVAQCRNDGVDVNYLVVGSGKKRKEYQRLAEELRIAAHVRFVGNVPEAELPAVFNIASAYVGVSRRADGSRVEGFGVALAEASACGLPVIAGQSGGLAEAVHDGETGLVVNPDDPEAVATALKRLLGDQLLARRLGQAGRKSIETRSE